jgi:chromosome segregation ATPase
MKLGVKEIFIIVLAALLVLSMVFRPSKEIDTYEDEINLLKQQNKELLLSNDSLQVMNQQLSEEIQDILVTIDSTEAKLKDTENQLNDLEDGKVIVHDRVRNLNADGIASELTDYLNRK